MKFSGNLYNRICLVLTLGFTFSCKSQNLPRVTDVYLFNNGFSYIHSSGQVQCNGGVYKIGQSMIPLAIQGTFWFASPGGISHVALTRDSVLDYQGGNDILNILASNVGKKVSINTGGQKIPGQADYIVSGVIESVNSDTSEVTVQNRLASATVVIKTETGRAVLFSSHLMNASLLMGEDATANPGRWKKQNNLIIHFRGTPSKADLRMSWLQETVSWTANYRLRLNKSSKADLSLFAEFSAPADFDKTNVNLVMAKPEVKAAPKLSYLSAIPEIKLTVAEANFTYDTRTASKNQWNFGDGSADVTAGEGKALDYYIYRLTGLKAKKGSSVQTELISGQIPVEHVYQCSLPPVSDFFAITAESNDIFHPVFHKLRLTNTLKQPFCEGFLTVEGEDERSGIFMAQIDMPEIPVNEAKLVTISRSMDMPVTLNETEVERVKSAVVIPGRAAGLPSTVYDKIKVKATVKLANKGKEEVKFKLNRQLSGNPVSSEIPWLLKKLLPKNSRPSDNYEISWDFGLKAGEEKQFSFIYEYYVQVN